MNATWICCQLGQREGYLAPRALGENGQSAHLVTEAWVPPGLAAATLGSLSPGLRNRYHPDLAGVPVRHATMRYLAFEALQRIQRREAWDLTLRRNDWFKDFAVRSLKGLRDKLDPARPVTLLSYSYTALAAFRLAKRLGWTCILCQMDCGFEHERIGRDLTAQYPWLPASHDAAPARYWEEWREECSLADRIVVNSAWAGKCLAAAGILQSKVRVIPLPELPSSTGAPAKRCYPARFDGARPLRVLFVGQVGLTKGIAALLEASALLESEPVEFRVVGPLRVQVPERFLRAPNIRWIGRVAHDRVSVYFRDADVFLFPSMCDGFGIVQSEAVADGLPVIASRFCGDVVVEGDNGIRLDMVSGTSIAAVLRDFAMHPERLQKLSAAKTSRNWRVQDYGRALVEYE